MIIHNLKIKPEYFRNIVAGVKNFEIRKNDRDFHVGDILVLEEYDTNYTGNFLHAEVIYILDDKQYLKDGYVALSIKNRLDLGAKLM